MIAGLSGSILSHDALTAAGLTVSSDVHIESFQRDLLKWHLQIERQGGPTWTARKVFDEVASPFCAKLGFLVVPVSGARGLFRALLQVAGDVVATVVAAGWGQDPSSLWADTVRGGIGADVRWCFAFNGPSMRLFDAARTYSRRFVDFELSRIAYEPTTFAIVWHLLRAESFSRSSHSALDEAVLLSDRYRSGVRESLQAGVLEALTLLTGAFASAARKARRSRASPSAVEAYDESLVVVYRILFLLFAEARGLVPGWHPLFRDSYTIESLRPAVETEPHARGIWETLQAIARLAHRGCRAGSLHVPPFNGRLFSPTHAPLAESLPLDDRRVRDALLALTTRVARDRRERIAYGDLGVEHLGGVYEGVLDFDVATTGTASKPSKATALRLSKGDGSPVFVRSGRRKSTGTFYTPRAITDYLVRRTLAPLVDTAGPDDILRLRVLDPAMGSGAFLVAACRYLAQSYERALMRDGVVAAIDVTEHDRASYRRAVAQRCLFGVDLNPMAVQLSRLSLWLATLSSDRPLTFFDHHLRAGNSLVGASIEDISRSRGHRRRMPGLTLFDGLDHAIGLAVASHAVLRDGPEDTLEQVRFKERTFAELTSSAGPLARWKQVADLWCARWFDDGVRHVGRGVFESLLAGTELPAHVAEPLLGSATGSAARERFFHWTLEFPEVFSDERGRRSAGRGFDAVIGNPPWEMLRRDAGADRANAGVAAARLTRFARGSGAYELQRGGHANLYQLFLERALSLVRVRGRVGLLVPSGFATDHGCASLRRHVLDETTVDSIVSVENRSAIFPVHRSLKFLLLTATSGGSTPTLPYRSGPRSAADLERLPESGTDPKAVTVSRELLERMSGDQLAMPDLRNLADAALTARLIFLHPAAGDQDGWGVRFGRELNATDDRRYFVAGAPDVLPVIEGKQIQPFSVDLRRSRAFIDRVAAEGLIPGVASGRSRLAYRDVASCSNRLTLIAAILPPGTVSTHTLFCLKTPLDDDAQHFLCGMFNSFVANYLVRLRVTTHVTTAIIDRLAVPKPPRNHPGFGEMARIVRGLVSRPVDPDAAARHQALAARIYGLTEPEFEHVLTTFPLVPASERQRALAEFLSMADR